MTRIRLSSEKYEELRRDLDRALEVARGQMERTQKEIVRFGGESHKKPHTGRTTRTKAASAE